MTNNSLTKQILIVDDNLLNLEQISAQLESHYDVILAKSGQQALKICQQTEPDLILLDVEMPEMSGFETITKLKENLTLKHVPVIFLTASKDTATEIKALKLGAIDFISKPVEKDILLHRIRVHLSLSEYNRHLENTVRIMEDSVIASFSDMIEYRDENTGGHVARTGKYVKLLARELFDKNMFTGEISESAVEMMARAAPLHDVGKIGISDVILLKPMLLNDEEFAIMKTHTTIGAEILKGMFSRMPKQRYHDYAVMIAESHHERWDGKGYPQGLREFEIPLCARIMSIADVFDALIDVRVYKKPMSHQDACRVIISGKGTMFDPNIVDIFESIESKLEEIAKKD
jgi:putative two-component system response regulator